MGDNGTKNYYDRVDNELPVHLSVGAVLVNDKGQVCCHYFDRFWDGIEDIYLLMRETVEPGETLEQAVHRGLMEEWGVTAEIKNYIGSIKSDFPAANGERVQKTTLYFLCQLKSQEIEKRQADDFESVSKVEWLDPKILRQSMATQPARYNRTDIDESLIIRSVFPE